MSHDDAGSIEQLAGEIHAYLERHPAAADTLEGIVAWWMARQRFEQSAERVARALDHLIRKGAVTLHRTPGDRWVYSGRNRAEDLTRDTFNTEGPMAAKIENLTDKPLWLRLNSGASLAIPPHALSPELPDHEVEGNLKLDKLTQRRAIARRAAGRPAAEEGRKPDERKGPEEAKGDEPKSDKGKTRRPG